MGKIGATFSKAEKQSKDGVPLGFREVIRREIIAYNLPTKVAVWSKSHKLIIACDTGKASLYNLALDPGETIDLSATAPMVLKVSKIP